MNSSKSQSHGTVRLYDSLTGVFLREYVGGYGAINALAFNPFLQAAINGREAAEKFKSQLEERNSVKY